MKYFLGGISLVFLGFLGLNGCKSAGPSVEPMTYVSENMQSAQIIIDGESRGFTPATVRVHRSFGESEVLLRIKNINVRSFDIEWTPTGNRSTMDFSYNGEVSEGMVTFNISELPTVKDSIIVIPYYNIPIKVVDLEYGLDLIVMN